MSSEPQAPDDRELQDLLAGRHPLSRAYADAARDEMPPPAVDAAVRDFARRAAGSLARRRRWQRPLAAAAVLVLAIGVLLRVLPETVPPPVPSSAVVLHEAVPREQQTEPAAAEMAAKPMARVEVETEAARTAPTTAQRKRQERSTDIAIAAPSAPAMTMASEDAAGLSEAMPQAPVPEARVALASPAPRSVMPRPRYADLLLGEADRDAVHARFGAPSSAPDVAGATAPQQAKKAEAAASPVRVVEHYAPQAKRPDALVFSYDAASLRLLGVRERFAEPMPLADFLTQRGWTPSDAEMPAACRELVGDEVDRLHFYPAQAAVLRVDAASRVLELIVDLRCRPA